MKDGMIMVRDALAAEGILSRPEQARYVPHQAYAATTGESAAALGRYAEENRIGDRSITVFVDGTPKKTSEEGGSDADTCFRKALSSAGWAVDWIVLSERFDIPPEHVHASHDLVEKTRALVASLGPKTTAVLGSGSITDIVKHALFLEGRTTPFISIPTALTVTAFTSAFAIIDFHGAKRTQLSREVSATFWTESILDCAPPVMSRAGYGDLLARFVAYGDWFLGKRLGVMDRYDETALRLMEPFAGAIRSSAPGFSAFPLQQETCRVIAAALSMAGIAMSVSGETTPLSGFEHVISHGLDFLRLTSGRELVFHGEQVGLACLTSARAIDWLLNQDMSANEGWITDPEEDGMALLNTLIDQAPFFGNGKAVGAARPPDFRERVERAREEFSKEYARKSARWRQEMEHLDDFIKGWPDTREHLAAITMRTAEMAPLVRASGLPMQPAGTSPPTSPEEFLWAVRFAPFVRNRMNIADLIFWMGANLAKMVYTLEDAS